MIPLPFAVALLSGLGFTPGSFSGVAQEAPATESSSCSAHHAGVDSRGDHVMGFDHEKTAHHFHLYRSGGAIDVSANDPGDAASRDAIREHLGHIARMFAGGDFEAPMLIHDRVPPGVPTLKARRQKIRWEFETSERGGVIRVRTEDREALSAIHEFLKFQIEDHRTGDSTAVVPDPTPPGPPPPSS